jgi:hypothetical protein
MDSPSLPAWKRFCEWMIFSMLLASSLVLVQAFAKLAERSSFDEIAWLTSSAKFGSYIVARLLLVSGLSVIVSAIATAFGLEAPYSRSKRKESILSEQAESP